MKNELLSENLKWLKKINETKQELDSISPTFCSAKWLQVTLHLQNGLTHSCHHPAPHKIPPLELEKSLHAFHNTKHKIEQRQMMIHGKRPNECEYCWAIEDSSEEAFSDRLIKSSDEWAKMDLQELSNQKYPIPTYLEVSFSNVCNMKCIYCSPEVSSSIWDEHEKFGPYPVRESTNLNWIKENGREPFRLEKDNPYLNKFDNWFSKIYKNLKIFRITGGEPLLTNRTFKTLSFLRDNPSPNLTLSINSNFMVSRKVLTHTTNQLDSLVAENKIKEARIYTSVDSHGEQANWIRHGLNYDQLIKNINLVMKESQLLKLTVISTFNIFSYPRFTKLLEDILTLKKTHITKIESEPRLMIDITYIREPSFLSPQIAPDHLKKVIKESLSFMMNHPQTNNQVWGFNYYEINKMQRLHDLLILQSNNLNLPDISKNLKDLGSFIREYDRRKSLNALKTFPEMNEFLNQILN